MNYFEQHKPLIEQAVKAVHERGFYTPYPEHHKAYSDQQAQQGEQNFRDILDQPFVALTDEDNSVEWIGEEVSPYTGKALGVTYSGSSANKLVNHAEQVKSIWKNVDADERIGLLAEVLHRLQDHYFELAHATQHTTGQAFNMAFQASGPHSNDRALEAAVLTWHEIKRFPGSVVWEKPMGKFSIKLDKAYHAVPKGIGLVIGCSTFPVWNTVPGLFANLAAGNPVIVKPHPLSVLPIAIVIKVLRELLLEVNLPANIVQLAVDSLDKPITKELVEHPSIKLIDYTGGPEFGNYVESLTGKTVFTEKAGVNCVILDSVEDLDAVLQNLAFSVSLYSGQMCTAPQNFFIPAQGIQEGDKTISFDEVAQRFKQAVDAIVEHPKMGVETLGTIQNERTLQRVRNTKQLGANMLSQSEAVVHSEYENARCISLTVMIVDANQNELYSQEQFGPICFLVKTQNTQQSIELAASIADEMGAISCGAYTVNADIERSIRDKMEQSFTSVSFNYTGFIWLNQSAGFSDFHVSGGNPAGNASFTNPEYANKRFVWVQHRKLIKV